MANSHALYATGTTTPVTTIGSGTFDVVNTGTTHLSLAFLNTSGANFTPRVVNLPPSGRTTVTAAISAQGTASYYPSYYTNANLNPGGRYKAWDRGNTLSVAPAGSATTTALGKLATIFGSSRMTLTGSGWSGRYALTASPHYGARTWALDVLTDVEHGRDAIAPADIKTEVDLHLSLQLASTTNYCAAGALPDYIEQDCTTVWGTEIQWNLTGQHLRSAIDHSLVQAQWAHCYGMTQGFDSAWATWFASIKDKLAAAFNSQPFNSTTGLIKQWDTYPAVCWSYLDTVKQSGDLIATSILAYNFSAAMQDMCAFTGDTSGASTWQSKADALRDGIRARWQTNTNGGFLGWNTGNITKFGMDPTCYAVWSGILTDTQNQQASDYIAYLYTTDKAAHPTSVGDVFEFVAGARGALRGSLKSEDYVAGVAVYPESFFNGGYPPYNAFGQGNNGAYWFMAPTWVAATLNVSHPDLAMDYVAGMVADYNADSNGSYEGVFNNGTKSGDYYLASSAAVVASAATASAAVTVDVSPFALVVGDDSGTSADAGVLSSTVSYDGGGPAVDYALIAGNDAGAATDGGSLSALMPYVEVSGDDAGSGADSGQPQSVVVYDGGGPVEATVPLAGDDSGVATDSGTVTVSGGQTTEVYREHLSDGTLTITVAPDGTVTHESFTPDATITVSN